MTSSKEKKIYVPTGCTVPDTNSILQLDVRSEGINVGNRFSMSKDREEIFNGRRRGINIAIIDEVSGKTLLIKNFDTYAPGSYSNYLSKEIEKLDPGALVMICSSGDVDDNLDTRAKRAIATLGSSSVFSINTDSSWALVGIKGINRRAVERFNTSKAVDISTQVKLQPCKKFGLRITVQSAGTSHGNLASISIDGEEIELPSGSSSNIGLNVVVFDEYSGEVLHTRFFDTHSEAISDISPSDDFVDFIAELPKGRIVAIAIKGDAITHLTDSAKQACESIGSRLITHVKIDRSWAIIGRKGAAPGTVPESANYNAAAWSTYFLPACVKNGTFCNISVSSSALWGCSSTGALGTYFSVNDYVRPEGSQLCFGYGITIALINSGDCAIEQTETFNTHSSSIEYRRLSSFISNIPTGRLVLATVWADGTNYIHNGGRSALESIGSAHIHNVAVYKAWAMIGRKGAAPGSIPEAYYDSYTVSIGAHVPLIDTQLPDVSTCNNSLYPLNCRAGLIY